MMRTFVAKPESAQATRKWWVIDANNQPLGRLASQVAVLLRGKHKTTFTPHVDTGDFVIVINASKVRLTGRKPSAKKYYRHSGYPGGISMISFEDVIGKHPELPIQKAVKGMLPKNVLGRQLITKLKIYGTDNHPHKAQQPEQFAL
ncbi:MAG TPA: 50S ribosomal protein L13 [Polyangiaceae bacterium]|nr:50S ribosomal protein L13 [Polyangiaceae bacterium]